MHIAASNGFSGGYGSTGYSLQASAICGEGTSMERITATKAAPTRGDMPSPEEVGRLAGERAVERAGAGKPPTGAFPVIYDERVAAGVIGHLVQAINGAAVARGSSWLKDALGERVLPEGIDLIEDPFRPRIGARGRSTPKDCRWRGGRSSRTACSRAGSLDLATGRQLGFPSTGNAGRGTSAPPMPTVGNLALTQGDGESRGADGARWAPGSWSPR